MVARLDIDPVYAGNRRIVFILRLDNNLTAEGEGAPRFEGERGMGYSDGDGIAVAHVYVEGHLFEFEVFGLFCV